MQEFIIFEERASTFAGFYNISGNENLVAIPSRSSALE
jgi:hypothetical protein